MRGVQVLGGDLTVVDDLTVPAVAEGQVRIRVEACGICGSDLSLVKDAARFVEVAGIGDYDLARFDPYRPVTPGHEFAGTVLEVADDVDVFSIGDAVTGIGIATEKETQTMTIIGYSNSYPGGLSEEIVVDAAWLRLIPNGMDFDTATLAEPLHVGETHVQQSGWDGAPALVIGAGTIGLGVVVALAARGASDITVVEPAPRRREMAAALGAHEVVDPTATNVLDLIRSWTGPVTIFECSGRQGALGELTQSAPYGSHIQVAASGFRTEEFIPVVAQWRQLVVNFGSGPVDDPYGVTLQRLAEGRVDADQLITARLSLDRTAEAFTALSAPDEHIKIIIHPQHMEGRCFNV